MDAATMVSLCIAIGQDVPAVVEELLQQRESEAMQRADLQSYIAQRHYTENLQLQQRPGARPMTWQTAYTRAHNLIVDLRDGIGRALVAFRMGRPGRAEEVVERMALETDDFGTSQAGSDTSPMGSDTSSQPAEAPSSGARSLPDEEMLAEGDEQM